MKNTEFQNKLLPLLLTIHKPKRINTDIETSRTRI